MPLSGKPIGKGKFGQVYAAKQKSTNQKVALKVLFKIPMQSANCIDSLRREVEIQCRLKHSNIVQLHGYDVILNPSVCLDELIFNILDTFKTSKTST